MMVTGKQIQLIKRMAKMPGGGYAEYAVVKAEQVTPVPDGLEFGQATALLAQGLTALGLLKNLVMAQRGEMEKAKHAQGTKHAKLSVGQFY